MTAAPGPYFKRGDLVAAWIAGRRAAKSREKSWETGAGLAWTRGFNSVVRERASGEHPRYRTRLQYKEGGRE
jgi:hypothetical protein